MKAKVIIVAVLAIVIIAVWAMNTHFHKGFKSDPAVEFTQITSDTDTVQLMDVRTKVEKRVREIYDEVFGWYLAHVDDPCKNDFDDKKFFSKDYWKVLSDVIRADTESEELGFFDCDHWIQAQDWDKDLALHIDTVKLTDDHHAFVHSHITNCGSKSSLIIAMIFEEGAWFIDDFIRPDIDNPSEKENMKVYIEH